MSTIYSFQNYQRNRRQSFHKLNRMALNHQRRIRDILQDITQMSEISSIRGAHHHFLQANIYLQLSLAELEKGIDAEKDHAKIL